jgi:hypothetical protein
VVSKKLLESTRRKAETGQHYLDEIVGSDVLQELGVWDKTVTVDSEPVRDCDIKTRRFMNPEDFKVDRPAEDLLPFTCSVNTAGEPYVFQSRIVGLNTGFSSYVMSEWIEVVGSAFEGSE